MRNCHSAGSRRGGELTSAGPGRERSEKDNNVISLVLHTFRNLAAMKDRVSTSDSADAIEQSTLQVRPPRLGSVRLAGC